MSGDEERIAAVLEGEHTVPFYSVDGQRILGVSPHYVSQSEARVLAAALVVAGVGDVAAAKAEALREAATYLRRHGSVLFDKHGPHDARGAGLWDAGCAIDPDDGDAFAVGRARIEAAARDA